MKIFKNAFTLAEVLIVIAIVGVVSAIILPTLINKINDIQYDTARQKALSTIGEAGRLIAIEGNMNNASNAEEFVKEYLSKKLKIVKLCNGSSTASLEECGLAQSIKTLNGNDTNMPTIYNRPYDMGSMYQKIFANQPSYGFVMANGYSVNLFYNPNCTLDTDIGNYLPPTYVCFNAVYDMNGLRNPNQVGKDIGFVTVMFPNEQSKAVAPKPALESLPLSNPVNFANAQKTCADLGKDYYLPDLYETEALVFNAPIIGILDDRSVWTSTPGWIVYFRSGAKRSYASISTTRVICTKKYY